MGGFDMLNCWRSAVAISVVFSALELGLYFFYYLPNRASTPGSSPERTVPGHLEDPASTTRIEGTVPAAGKSPPVGKWQYSSPGATGP
jgi:hypothetical protein